MVVDEQADLRLNYVADKIQIKIIKLTPQQQLKQNQSKSIRWCFALMFKTLHQYLFGFSALCILICLLKSPASLNHIDCICFTFLHCVFSNGSSNRLPEKMHSRIGCIHMTYISVRFQIWRSKVALVAFVWLFSTVCFQMSPQIACLGRSKVTLVAWGNKL